MNCCPFRVGGARQANKHLRVYDVEVGLDDQMGGQYCIDGELIRMNGQQSLPDSHCCNQACPPSVQRKRNILGLKALNSEVAHCGFWSRFLTFYHEPVLLGFKIEPTVLQDWVPCASQVFACFLLLLFVLFICLVNLTESRVFQKKESSTEKKKTYFHGMALQASPSGVFLFDLFLVWEDQSIVNSAASRKENRLSKPVAAASLMASASVPAWACPDGLHSARGHKPLPPHVVFGPGVYHSQEKTS